MMHAPRLLSRRHLRYVVRGVAIVLACLQLLPSQAPLILGAARLATTGTTTGRDPVGALPPLEMMQRPEQARPPRVTVNRRVPRVAPPPQAADIPLDATSQDLARARVFPEPLVPIGRASTREENRALAHAIRGYLRGKNPEAVAPLLQFLYTFPGTPWRASLLANLGTVYSRTGQFSRALRSWNDAWTMAKDAEDPRGRAVAYYAIGEWLDTMMKLGQVEPLRAKLAELDGREIGGTAGAKITLAREALTFLTNNHHEAVPSARVALTAWLTATRGHDYVVPREVVTYHASAEGTSLVDLQAFARQFDSAVRALYRDPEAEPSVPAIVHLRVGHYAALVEAHVRADGRGAYLMRDVILGDRWISREALDDEASGYVIVGGRSRRAAPATAADSAGPIGPGGAVGDAIAAAGAGVGSTLPAGWRQVDPHEGRYVIGHCAPGLPDGNDSGPEENDGDEDDDDDGDEGDPDTGDDPDDDASDDDDSDPADEDGDDGNDGDGDEDNSGDDDGNDDTCPIGMPVYSIHPVTAALRVQDVPLAYSPPRGPAVQFRLQYDHRAVSQPQILSFGNVGPRWKSNWLSYIDEFPGSCTAFGCASPAVTITLRGFGREIYIGSPASVETFGTDWRSKATLVRVSRTPIRYERRMRGGGVEIYGQSDGGIEGQRRVFLTEVIDARGQSLQFTYDGGLRLVAVTDALGQVTTLSYEDGVDPLKLTKVTDPFGRFASLAYSASGQLTSITDMVGLTSSFVYNGADFIGAMKTPYGTTSFRMEPQGHSVRWLEASDPLGGTERLEFWYQDTTLASSLPSGDVPAGFTLHNENLQYYNTYYWNKRAMALHPGDRTKATLTHWLYSGVVAGHPLSASIPHSVKRPLESRVWYMYANQHPTTPRGAGSWYQPTRIARKLDDGSFRVTERTYNNLGRVTSRTDAAGRRRSYVYAANGIDLLEIRQTTGSLNESIASYSNYGTHHRPGTIVDAAGETTLFTYNSAGQTLTKTDPTGGTMTFTYDAGGDGYRVGVSGTAAADSVASTHDVYGRTRTLTLGGGYSLVVDYDALNRVTKLTYPDDTYEQMQYDRLDPVAFRDRVGRWTRYTYDVMRRPTSTRDPLGRLTTSVWCGCGSLEQVVDAKGQITSWDRDLQGRPTRELRDGTQTNVYTYDTTTSRLKTVTDARSQIKTFSYNADGTVAQVAYTSAVVSTANVSYTYDPSYLRHASMTDGAGTTTYTYGAIGTVGALMIASIDGPFTSDTLSFTYDELGRAVTRTLNGGSETRAYDAAGRMDTLTVPAGTFTFDHAGPSGRLSSVEYPNGVETTLTYFNDAEKRLHTLQHKKGDGSNIVKHDYTYDALGNLTSWRREAGVLAATLDVYEYDAASQLTVASTWSTSGSPSLLKRRAFAYDAAGNRTSVQIDDQVIESLYGTRNRLIATRPGGVLQAAGHTNEPATVTVQGRAATTAADNSFRAPVLLTEGTTTVAITATDGSGNTRSQSYEIDALGNSRALTYDANGNLTSDGQRAFTWDAENRIATVVKDGVTTSFVYNGLGERVQMTIGGTTTTYVLDRASIVEERQGGTVRRHVRGPAHDWLLAVEEVGTGTTFFVGDHLDTLTMGLDGTGAVVFTREYDPFGVLTAGAGIPGEAFTGRPWLPAVGLYDYRARAYDPELGRFLSEDPGGFRKGINLYAYVVNNPLRLVDPNGEEPFPKANELFLFLYMLFTRDCRPETADSMRRALEFFRSANRTTISAPPTPGGGPKPGGGLTGGGGAAPGGGILFIIFNPCKIDPKMCTCTDKGCFMRTTGSFQSGPAE